MSSALEVALSNLIERLAAAAVVVWRQARDDFQVLASAPVGIMAHGAPWPMDAVGVDQLLVVTGRRALARAVPAELRLALPAAVHTVMSSAIAEADLAFTVVWTTTPPPDAAAVLRAAITDGVDLMAIDLERRVHLAVEHRRLASVMQSLDQAVLVFDQREATGTVNGPAAELLGLPGAGDYSAAEARQAFQNLRRRAVHASQFDDMLTKVIADPNVMLRDRVWRLTMPTAYYRVSTTPYAGDGHTGRVWTFDDVTREMLAVSRLELAAAELRESRARYEMLAQYASDVVFRTSPDGYFEWVSESVRQLLGFEPDDLVGSRFQELIQPDDFAEARERYGVRFADERLEYVGRFRQADGDYRWLEVTARLVVSDDGEPLYRIGSARDVHERVLAERARTHSDSVLRAVVDGMLDPQVLLEPVFDDSGAIVDFTYVTVNLATEKALGVPRARIEGRTLRSFQPGGDDAGLVDLYARSCETRMPILIEGFRYSTAHADEVMYFDIRGTWVGNSISLTWRDVTEQTKIRKQLEHQARTDPLTGVLNRAAGVEVAGAKLQARRLPGNYVALLFCDIDHFKELNDAFGHRSGDVALQTMADRIRDVVRGGDVVARLGGDEFLVVLDGVHGPDDAIAIGEKVRRSCNAPIVIEHGVIRPSMSVGAVVGEHGDDFDTLLARADAAMYVAKGAGRNRVVVATAAEPVIVCPGDAPSD